MTKANLHSFPTVSALAPSLRSYIAIAENHGLMRHGVFKIAVSGGSLPKTLAQALLAPTTDPKLQLHFDNWEIYFADERAVELNHPDSNYFLLKQEFLDKLAPDQGTPKLFPINSKLLNDTQQLADDYEQELVKGFASRDSVRLPVFDLILLGCGPDGHTCSLFPGHPLLKETSAWVAPIEDSPKPPPKRITLTMLVVTHAVRVAFIATGGGKKEIMKEIFDNKNMELPCATVNELTGDRCSWFVDDAAVEGVAYARSDPPLSIMVSGSIRPML